MIAAWQVPPAAVGDDCRGQLHHRLPVRVGHVRHQHVALLYARHERRTGYQAHRPRADLVADGAAGGKHRAAALETEVLLGAGVRARLDRFRARLQNVDAAVAAILAPFDVHWPAIVLFDDHCGARQLQHVSVLKRVAVAVRFDHLHRAHRAAGARGFGEHHFLQLGAERAPDHRRPAALEHGFVHVKLIRVDRALHHHLAQSVGRSDEHHPAEPGLRIEREHDPARTEVAAHHLLHGRRKGDVAMCKALVRAVGDGSIVVQRGEHMPDRLQDAVRAVDVQKGFLLACERRVRQILGGRR